MEHINCILKNNTDKHVRVIVISWFGQGDYLMGPQQSVPVVFIKSFKSLTAYDQTTQEPIGWYFLEVEQETIFKVNMQYSQATNEWLEPNSAVLPVGGSSTQFVSHMLGGMQPYKGEPMN